MGIEAYFKGSRVICSIVGKNDEYMNLSRFSRGSTRSVLNNVFKALLQSGTQIVDGDIVTIDNDAYFVTAIRSSHTGTTMCQLQKVNAVIDIVRITKHFTATKVNDYDYEVPLHTAIPCFYEEISGRMMQYDAGLKATSTRRFLIPKLDFKLTDRIKINGNNACIDVINESSYPGLLSVQTSIDTRPTKAVK